MVRSRMLSGLLATLALAGTARGEVPAAEAVPTVQQLAAMGDKQLDAELDKALADESGNMYARHCRIAALAGEAQRRGGKIRPTALALSEGFCAMHHKDYALATKRLARLEELGSEDDNPEYREALDSLILTAASNAKDLEAFELHARHISDRNWPGEFSRLDLDTWSYRLHRLGDAEVGGRVALRFVEARSYPYLPEDLRKMFAFRAVRPAIKAGKAQLAGDLALRDPSAYSLLGMLIDRDYEAIWPRLESAAGAHLETILAAELATAREQARLAPDDRSKRNALARSLLFTRDYAGVVALAAKVDRSPASVETMSEDDAWLLNNEVRALDFLGRRADADAVFDLIGTLDPDRNKRGWVVNFAINRADRLVGQGRWKEAMPAAEQAVSVSARYGSPYAKEVAAVDRYCAAIKLDPKRAELAAWWAEIAKNFKDNIGAAIQAAQCKGDTAMARTFIREGLIDIETRQSTLRALQPRAFDLYRDEANMFDEPRLLLHGDPALQALFRKYGRELPAPLLPR